MAIEETKNEGDAEETDGRDVHENESKRKRAKADEEDDKGNDEEESTDDKPLDPKVLERSPRWADVKPVLNTFLRATLQLITESKEPDLLSIVLKSLSKYLRYMTPFPRMAEALLKTLVSLWSAPLGPITALLRPISGTVRPWMRPLANTHPMR